MTEIVFAFPTKDTPGYLKRQRDALKLKAELAASESEASLGKLVEFLARYVTEPADPEAAVEAIWEMSEDQFNSALGHLTAGSQTPPKVSGQ